MKPFLSVIIPAYNESKRITHTLLDIDRYLSSEKFKKIMQQYNADKDAKGYEILVVDDGSKDNTVEVVKKFQSIIKNLKIIENQINHGKGFAVRQGMIKARGKLRLFTDADNSTSIDHIEKIIPYLPKIDIALVMTVNAGMGGQQFIEENLEKVRVLRKEIDKMGIGTEIQVDGGINPETGKKALEAGADILVAGSYIMKSDDIVQAIKSLKELSP